jgi:hypothetical protein
VCFIIQRVLNNYYTLIDVVVEDCDQITGRRVLEMGQIDISWPRVNPEFHAGADHVAVIVAHPDDEQVFFRGWLDVLTPRSLDLVCVTGRFALGESTRRTALQKSADELGARLTNLELEDRIDAHLDEVRLMRTIGQLEFGLETIVLTHGPLGDYGHAHHADVFWAAWRAFGHRVWSLSGPLEDHATIRTSANALAARRSTVRRLYPDQGRIDLHCVATESLCHVCSSEFAPLLRGDCAGEPERVRALFDAIERRRHDRSSQEDPKLAERWKPRVLAEWVQERERELLERVSGGQRSL